MGYIFCMMGKSSCGKDSIHRRLMADPTLHLERVIPYTTRPIRDGEISGQDYFFCSEEHVQELERENRIIELRAYNTQHGVWKYFTADDGQIDPEHNYLMIGTLEAYTALRRYFGEERVVPIYIEVEDGERLQRALTRERLPYNRKYAEMCRRFLADQLDFSEEKIEAAGITRRFENLDADRTAEEIRSYIREKTGE